MPNEASQDVTTGDGAVQGSDSRSVHAAIIAELFANVFEVESVDPQDDFFELGGDSLLGAALMATIEERFGCTLSISALLEKTTPAGLADLVLEAGAQRVRSALTKVQDEGNPPTVLCLHGTGGESHLPMRLSKTLHRPIYAFRAIGLEAGEDPLETVESIASAYLAALDQTDATGPYLVLGHCACSVIALETARQLVEAGIKLAGLVLIDPEDHTELAPFLYRSGMELMLFQTAWGTRAAKLREIGEANPNPSGEMRRDLVADWIKHAVGTHTPRPYDGRTLMCLTGEDRAALLDPVKGYPGLMSDLKIVRLGMSHEKVFTEGLVEVAQAIDLFVEDSSV